MERKLSVTALILLIGIFFCGCDGSYKTKEIKAKSFPGGHVLTLPVDGRTIGGSFEHYGGSSLFGKISFADQIEELESEKGLVFSAVPQQYNTWLIQSGNDEKKDLYVVRNTRISEDNKYMFTPAKIFLVKATGEGDEQEKTEVLFPLHLVPDHRAMVELIPTLIWETEYEIEGNDVANVNKYYGEIVAAIKEFYEVSGYYDVRLDDGVLTLLADSPLKSFQIELSYRYSNVYLRVFEII